MTRSEEEEKTKEEESLKIEWETGTLTCNLQINNTLQSKTDTSYQRTLTCNILDDWPFNGRARI